MGRSRRRGVARGPEETLEVMEMFSVDCGDGFTQVNVHQNLPNYMP